MRHRLRRTAAALLAAFLLTAAITSSPATASTAGAMASGFDDWTCKPSAAHPNPLVLLHGLGGNGPGNYSYLGPFLAAKGYCAFTLTYGQATPAIPVGGTLSIAQSSAEIASFVQRVRRTTGAAKVDIVGHSEGGFQSIYGPKVLGYADQVGKVIALAPPTHGTTFGGLVSVGDYLGLGPLVDQVLRQFGCPACDELIVGGSAVAQLTAGPIAQPGVKYTVIASRFDALVTPHETSFIREPGVTNEFVQDTCPLDTVGHVGLAFDPTVAQLVANALDPTRATRVTCAFGPPL
ncbi:triacylglycerol esterase/lipase EstA (alpha/beta hydrolase family) [Kribbella pratensis]|uniref:Triacylglycerol esterase/lipase EstA (Alpha/beta hydrolase family) n=1 Tax=Kribbella pratensis TaxID=2512112 RepID=A0ABY2FRA9_9ACTN|nr:alpha/beta fold hydrolase [Kribbella pratensis]TDW95472.1 triacylglycerol esterase/lipase EstA (alpha/beta hydrolase family) [Kribbella pratensis]